MNNQILSEPVYQSTYRLTQNLCKGRIKAARMHSVKACNLGKDDPAKANLLFHAARRDALGDYTLFNCDTKSSVIKFALSFVKNYFKLCISSDVRKADKEFEEKYKELYPKTYKLRNKLLTQKRVIANNDSDVITRRLLFNP